MSLSTKHLVIGVATLLASTCVPANAFLYMGGDEVYEQLGMMQPPVNYDEQQHPVPTLNGSGTVDTKWKVVREAALTPSSEDASKLQQIGYWVGNLQFKVAKNSKGNLFVIDKKGQVSALPAKTNADAIVIPFNNPFVRGMAAAQPVAGGECQLRTNSQGADRAPCFVSDGISLRPTLMSTRTAVINGTPMILGGAIIQELPPQYKLPVPPGMTGNGGNNGNGASGKMSADSKPAFQKVVHRTMARVYAPSAQKKSNNKKAKVTASHK